MATREWLDVDGNWANTANWSGGATPVDGDDALILRGSKAIVTNVDQSTIALANLKVGREFTGSIGTASSPLLLETVSTEYIIDAPNASALFINPGVTTPAARGLVLATGVNTYAFALAGGSTTLLILYAAEAARILAAATVVTTLILSTTSPFSDVKLVIESGATLTTVRQLGGQVLNYAALTTLEQLAGSWQHLGDTVGTITTLNQWGGLFEFSAPGRTITAANQYGGVIDCRKNPKLKTITTFNQYAGDAWLQNNEKTVTVTTHNKYGGRHTGTHSVTPIGPGGGQI